MQFQARCFVHLILLQEPPPPFSMSSEDLQASKQAGKGTEIKRVHVKSHLWLFVNCYLAGISRCCMHFMPLISINIIIYKCIDQHYMSMLYLDSVSCETKAWLKILPSVLRQRSRWHSRLLGPYMALVCGMISIPLRNSLGHAPMVGMPFVNQVSQFGSTCSLPRSFIDEALISCHFTLFLVLWKAYCQKDQKDVTGNLYQFVVFGSVSANCDI